ncbi:hypothetical protein OSTOST_07450 [Ostertagia ostertagi]
MKKSQKYGPIRSTTRRRPAPDGASKDSRSRATSFVSNSTNSLLLSLLGSSNSKATLGRFLKPALEVLVARSTPRSACIFCTLEENVDSHPSGRCPRYPNTYSRTFQVSKMGLCGQCLKPAHEAACKVMCGICRQPHNALLCPVKANTFTKKRKY